MNVCLDPYGRGVLLRTDADGGPMVALTRDEAKQLRDDLTDALNSPGSETPEQRHHRELHDGTLTVIPPEGDPRDGRGEQAA